MIRTFLALLILSGAYAQLPVVLEPPEENLSLPENIPLTVEDAPSPPNPNDPDFSSRVSVELEESTHLNTFEESDLKTDATWWPYYRFRYPRFQFRYYRPRPYYRRHYYW